MRAVATAVSDIGRVRSKNEDRFVSFAKHNLHAVADGVGGAPAGERAAQLFVDTVAAAGDRFGALAAVDGDIQEATFRLFEEVFAKACTRIYEAGQIAVAERGMATTGILLWLARNRAYCGHVGDSRAYLLRGDRCLQLTKDHTIGQGMLDQGALTEEQVERLVYRDVLSRSIGRLPHCSADTLAVDLEPGDRLLICSDGLYRELEPASMLALAPHGIRSMVDAALASGGKDNITGVLVTVEECSPDEGSLSTFERVKALKEHFLFRYLTEQELLRTMRIIREHHVQPGEKVVRAGDPGDRIFSVVAGEVAVSKGGVTLTTLGPGAGFGEIAFTDSRPRSADVVARTQATLLSIGRDDFHAMTREDSAIAWKLLWCFVLNLSERLRTLTDDFVTGKE